MDSRPLRPMRPTQEGFLKEAVFKTRSEGSNRQERGRGENGGMLGKDRGTASREKRTQAEMLHTHI